MVAGSKDLVIRVRKTDDSDLVGALHVQILPSDDVPDEWDVAWVAWDRTNDQACGFATARVYDSGASMFLQRSGVMPYARGHRLQRRFLRARETWAREQGIQVAITYTTYYNHASIVNLLRAGYRFYYPRRYWVGPDVHYFQKEL